MTSSELPDHTEVLVIGGGPGGYAAAFQAAALGLDVTLVNDEPKPGGVCLRRGCIPSKTLLHLAELLHATDAAESMGVHFGSPRVDPEEVRAWKDRVVEKLSDGLVSLCERRGVRLVQARATFDGADRVRLDTAERATLRFRHAVIATGSRPVAMPGTRFDDSRRIMDSAAALDLEQIPDTLLVVGGGYVGLEMGTVYQALGSRVTLVEMADRLMPGADHDLVKPLAAAVGRRFESVRLNTRIAGLTPRENDVEVTLTQDDGDPETLRVGRALIAIGRTARTDRLGLETTGVTRNDDGTLPVDAQRRTDVDAIFAVGDTTGGMKLAHEAMHEGKTAARAIAGQRAAFDARAIPAVVYTMPQIAWCGLTEQQAAAGNREIRKLAFPWQASGRALSMGTNRGLTKLLTDPVDGRILGMGVVGPHAESLIAEGVLAMEMVAVAEDLASAIHPHPTLTETVGEAAELFLGGATHYG